MKKLKALRKSKKLTLDDLGGMLGCKKSTISMWENGKRSISIPMLKKLAKIFECSFEDLID